MRRGGKLVRRDRLDRVGRVLALVFALSGCNQLYGLDPTGLRFDAAPIDGPGCSDGKFGGPMVVSGFEGAEPAFEPQLRHDLLEVWFIRPGNPPFDIYRATRTDPSLPFGTPELMLGDSQDDTSPSLTADGLRLMFVSSRVGANEVWEMTRPTLADPFGPPTRVLGLADRFGSFDVSFDGNTLYYTQGDGELYETTRDGAGFSAPRLIGTKVTFISMSPDALEVFSNSTESRHLEQRVRASTADMFTSPPILILDEGDDPDLAPDGRTLIMATNNTLVIEQRDCPK